jgi:Mrp family chromosome partitioning ATPase
LSRNFELLQKIGKDQELFQAQPVFTSETKPPVEAAEPPLSPTLKIGAEELEEVTKLVQRLFVLPGDRTPQVVVFMGTESGTGCSWMCARAAEVLASQVRGSVCVLDANLQQPAQHVMLGVANHHGLADALRVTEPIGNFVRQLWLPNLYLLSCGSDPENLKGLVSSERMRQRLAELRNMFDYVLIDAPSVSTCNDGVAMSCGADGVVIVLKANSSRREPARKAIKELQHAGARVLGAVLNQRTFPIPQSIYDKL